ncbi:Aste57867_11153 [Aphanomyces stellatus]|uniref:Aste57867_11153 protein n=1 Tax=Aphanomyces stellatus TaxID=120398 RepID=A0A485KU21_9STRA|nr:hypothetical protein As57867_011111 [Aphanomyces stellatus]VFT88020.1 Aste57867_11153 [Aphanomyces stellatus]
MGTAAHVVNIPSDSVIAEFKNAVTAVNLNKLATFDPSELHVYANLDELHKENPVPLEEDSAIGTFGLSMKGALYVVVPSHALVAVPDRLQEVLSKLENIEQDLRELKRLRSSVSRSVIGN